MDYQIVDRFKVIIHCEWTSDEIVEWNWYVPLDSIIFSSKFGRVKIVEIASDYSEIWVEKAK